MRKTKASVDVSMITADAESKTVHIYSAHFGGVSSVQY